MARKSKKYDINPILWFMHFGDISPEEATCKDCTDYIEGLCEGGKNPIECMKKKTSGGIIVIGGG